MFCNELINYAVRIVITSDDVRCNIRNVKFIKVVQFQLLRKILYRLCDLLRSNRSQRVRKSIKLVRHGNGGLVVVDQAEG